MSLVMWSIFSCVLGWDNQANFTSDFILHLISGPSWDKVIVSSIKLLHPISVLYDSVFNMHVMSSFLYIALAPQFETQCSYVEATLEEFLAWTCEQPTHISGPFSCFDSSKYWAYADYKYIARIFEDKTEIFKVNLIFTFYSGLCRKMS